MLDSVAALAAVAVGSFLLGALIMFVVMRKLNDVRGEARERREAEQSAQERRPTSRRNGRDH
jgi:large-conductance mechanosensitive channel